MKFEEKYKFGANPPYCEYRRLLVHMNTQFMCVKCGCSTQWVLAPLMTATCSDECLIAQIGNKPVVVKPLHHEQSENHSLEND